MIPFAARLSTDGEGLCFLVEVSVASSTIENYLKKLYTLQQREPDRLVSMGTLAEAVEVTAGTATAMVKTLADTELVDYQPRRGVQLTAKGRKIALHVLRRHRMLELFLVDVLGFDWSEVHDEAEVLEHAISDKLLERIDELLGHPLVDPHGDPIPAASGRISREQLRPLAACERGPVNVARITDHEPEFLRFLERSGLTPGAAVTVRDNNDLAELITVKPGKGKAIQLSHSVAKRVLVKGE